MATKQTFVQIVNKKTGQIEKIISMDDLNSMTLEDKISIVRGKQLFQIAYEIEPVIKVEMKKKTVVEAISYEPEEVVPEPKKTTKTRKSTPKK